MTRYFFTGGDVIFLGVVKNLFSTFIGFEALKEYLDSRLLTWLLFSIDGDV